MSEKEMIKFTKSTLLFIAVLLSLFFFIVYEFGLPAKFPDRGQVYSYQDTSDISVSHDADSKLARITIKDSYSMSGTEYYIFTTSITGDTEYTFSEEQYDAAFGLSNDAIDCQIYTLTLEAPVLQYKPNLCGKSPLNYFGSEYLPEYEPYADAALTRTPSFVLSNGVDYSGDSWERYFQKDVSKEVSVINECPGSGSICSLSCKMKLTRYSFLGEEDFTEEEIESYKEELNDLSSFVLDSFYDSF